MTISKYAISYYGEEGRVVTAVVEAESAADALVFFDINMRRVRVHPGSAGPYVGDVYAMRPVSVKEQG